MEQTYKDNIKLFKKHHLFTDYIALRLSEKRYLLIKNILGLDKIKIFLESILGKINFKRKRAAFTVLGLNTYILKKK